MVDPGRLVDRAREWSLLDEAWRRLPGLVLVYGRRRVGKTRLVLEWARARRHVYYQAGMWGHAVNLRGLARAFEEQLGLTGLSSVGDLRGLFGLASNMISEDTVVVIDEYTYWAEASPGIAGDFQWVVDHVLPGSRILLILTGSLVGVVERTALSGGGPLYGRAMLRLRLGELEPWCLPMFAPRYGPRELVELYSLFGGVPHYLRLVDDSLAPLGAWHAILGPEGVLSEEPLFVVSGELRDPHPYLSLLREVAVHPGISLGKAASRAGLPSSHASVYARRLVSLGILGEVPLLFSRRRLYRVVDKPLRSVVSYPGPEPLARESPRMREWYSRILSQGWEELAAKHAAEVLAPRLGIHASRAGRLIYRGSEYDWVIIDDEGERVLAAEATTSRLDPREAESQASRIRNTLPSSLPRELRHYRVDVALYLLEPAGGAGYIEVTPGDLPWGDCDGRAPPEAIAGAGGN